MGAAVPIIGGLFQAGGAQMEAADRAGALEEEALIASRNADIVREAGIYNAERQELTSKKVLGNIQADYGASGISQDSTSALEVLRDSHMSSEMDRLNILHGSELKAYDLEERASSATRGASRARQIGDFNTFAALFGAGAKAASYQGPSPSGGGGGGGGGYGSAGGSYSDYSNYA